MLRARFQVARELGRTFQEVATIDRWELAHWVALLRMEPPVADVMNVLNALLCAVVANSAFGARGDAKPARFVVDFEAMARPPKRLTAEQTKARWIAWASASGARK